MFFICVFRLFIIIVEMMMMSELKNHPYAARFLLVHTTRSCRVVLPVIYMLNNNGTALYTAPTHTCVW